jgi:DNA (cytosine-5)-methyltransferase 1
MTLTLTDMFCGAGGSSTGAIQVPGIEVRTAMNHWDLAIQTHNSNHPDADHIQADISQTDPRYVRRSDILWASPECTNHSRAKGKKRQTMQDELWQDTLPDEAAERSRATMWDVLRFAEVHQYRAMIVENVVEVVDWVFYPAWRAGLQAAGYHVQIVSLNSMHAQRNGDPAPQSRDRVYFVCTRKGDPIPDVRPKPWAWCPECGEVVRTVQSFKKSDAIVGRYRSQYVYRCPNVKCRNSILEPAWLPASTIIDWALKGERIGDRTRPLAPKTRARIAAGIARYWGPLHLEAAGNTYDAADPKHPQHGNPNSYYRAWSADEPLRTLHTIESKALAVPVEGRADVNRARPLTAALRTQNTRLETGIAQPPFIAELRGGGSTARPTADPLATVTASGNHHALVTSYYGNNDGSKPVTEALDTVTTTDRHALLTPAGGTWNDTAYPSQQPMRTLTTRETTALVMRHNTGGAEMVTPASEPIRTITTTGHQSILTTDDIRKAAEQVDDVLFRMLEPAECKRAMAFPGEYVMLGNRREQVKMAGNAVTPPAARDLIAAVAETLLGAA